MKVEFATNDLRRNYLTQSDGTRDWGQAVAAKYIRAIGVIANAAAIRDLSAVRNLRLHQLRGERAGEWAVDLHGRWRVCFTLNDGTVRVTEVSNHYGD